MKAYEGTVITLIAPRLVLAAVVGGEWSAPRAARFDTVKTVNSTHWLGDWVGSHNRGARLEGDTKSNAPSWNRFLSSPYRNLVTELSGLPRFMDELVYFEGLGNKFVSVQINLRGFMPDDPGFESRQGQGNFIFSKRKEGLRFSLTRIRGAFLWD